MGRRPRSPNATRTVEQIAWSNMISRCENPRSQSYQYYGARGVKVCERWHVFANFLADMGPRPPDKDSLDRYPNKDGDYEPGNCRWATDLEQNQNKRGLVMLTVDGETAFLAEWSRRTGLSEATLQHRVRSGWAHDRIVKTPARGPRLLTVDGETATLTEWSKRSGLSVQLIWTRINESKWDHTRAVKTPARGRT